MRVLVLGRTALAVADILRADPRVTSVMVACHRANAARDLEVGEPSYDLVLHDCSGLDVGLPVVNNRFLNEVTKNGGVHISLVQATTPSGVGHAGPQVGPQSGEATPVLVPGEVEGSIHLDPFLDSFGHLLGHRRVLRCGIDWVRLAVNQYGDAVVAGADSGLNPIVLARPPLSADTDSDAAQLLARFALQPAPAVHPELLRGLFTSRAANHLRTSIAEEICGHRNRLRALRAQLEAEEAYLARYAPLAQTRDERLKLSVKQALEDVFELEVVDLDHVFAEEKLADLYVKRHGLVIETKGSDRRAARRADVEQLDEHATKLAERGLEVSRRALVFNGQLGIPSAARTASPFAAAVTAEARASNVSLTTGAELLGWVIDSRAGEFSTESLIKLWSRPGPTAESARDPN